MAMYADPATSPEAFDRVVFNDTLRTPGTCKVTGWSREVSYDHKKGKGTKGAVQTLKELPPAKGSIEFITWTAKQRADWGPIEDALRFDPSKISAVGQSASSSTATTTTTGGATAGANYTGGAGTATTASSTTTNAQVPAAGQKQSSFTGNTPDAGASTANQPTPLSSAFAIAIYYPTLADIDVHFVLPPEKLGAWEPVGDDVTHMKRTIEFVEYTGTPPNSNVATTPTGAQDATTTPQSPGSQYQSGNPGEGPAPANAANSQSQAAGGAQQAWGSSSS